MQCTPVRSLSQFGKLPIFGLNLSKIISDKNFEK